MMMSAVIAVALGLVPVRESNSAQMVWLDDKVAAEVGHYSKTADKNGNIRLRGSDSLGRSYDLAIDPKGHVEGDAGSWHVTFDVSDVS